MTKEENKDFMTNEEAIMVMKSMKNSLTDIGFGWEQDGLSTAIASLEKADRYKWHDLRKNPDDLPEDGRYLVSVICKGKLVSIMADRINQINAWVVDEIYEMQRKTVVAWKEIEPFEKEATK